MKTTSINIVEADEIKQMNLPPELVNDLQINFNPLFAKAQEWKNKAESINVVDINDKEGMKAAREARLELKNIRVNADKIRSKLKEESLLKGKAIDGMYNIIKFLIVPIENHLEEQEKFAELQEEKRLNELTEKRISELSKYVEDVSIFNVRTMTDEAYNALLESQKKLFEVKQEELKKIELERIAKEKAEKEEQERIRLENEKLKKEAEERERKIAEERKIQEEKEAKEKAEREAKEKKEREEFEAKLKKEREEKEKLEAEIRAKKDAEIKAQKEEEIRLRKQQTAPDKDKLRKLAADLLAMEYPELQSEDGKKIVAGVKELMKKVNIYIVENIERL